MPAWKFILDKKIISTQDPFSNFCCASNHILVLHQQIELTHLLSPDSHTVGHVMTPEPVRVYFTFSQDFRNLVSCWSQHLSLYVRERLRITESWRLNLVEHLKKAVACLKWTPHRNDLLYLCHWAIWNVLRRQPVYCGQCPQNFTNTDSDFTSKANSRASICPKSKLRGRKRIDCDQ